MKQARSVSAVHLPIIEAFSQAQYGASKWVSLRTLTRHCRSSTVTGRLRFAGDPAISAIRATTTRTLDNAGSILTPLIHGRFAATDTGD